MKKFEDNLFFGEMNRFVGSGGEILVKKSRSKKDAVGTMEVGDQLIGIGITHLVESLDRAPGPESFHPFDMDTASERKMALRAFAVATKQQTPNGFSFTFKPLSPRRYSGLIEKVSDGAVKINPETIPNGTIILSFIDDKSVYSIKTMDNSPRANWLAVKACKRHWNVGIGKKDDFWSATFPSDQVGMLPMFSASETLGEIRFGLSLLPGSKRAIRLQPVETINPNGKTSHHDFCLTGAATGTKGINSPFPIGLRTAIIFRPIR